jgi:endoglycosylceramidase
MDDFSAFWGAVVAAYANTPGVIGYELLNEPWAGDADDNPLLMIPGVADAVNLQPFFNNVTLSIRKAEQVSGSPIRPVFLEPVTWDNMVPAGFTSIVGADQGLAGLSYHYYSAPDIIGAAWQIETRDADAKRLSLVPFLTEFDIDLPSPVNPPYSEMDLRTTLESCDKYGHGYLGWAYQSLWWGNGTLVLPAVKELARPFPLALAGNAASYAFDAVNVVFSLNYTHVASVAAKAPSTVFLSTAFWFPAATTTVTITSNPPGAVTYSLQQVPGAGPSDPPSGTPLPFAYAMLTIQSASGAPSTAQVFVTVSA